MSVEAGRHIRDALLLCWPRGVLSATSGATAQRSSTCVGSSGQLGDIEQVATRRQSPFPARISDVGVVRTWPHDVNLAAWVAGAPYESIYARTSARSGIGSWKDA